MIPSASNARSLWRCLCGRASSTCAHAISDVTAAPTPPANHLHESQVLPVPTKLHLPAQPFASTSIQPHRFPEPLTTTLETEQNPLKIDPRAKV